MTYTVGPTSIICIFFYISIYNSGIYYLRRTEEDTWSEFSSPKAEDSLEYLAVSLNSTWQKKN